ncbi:Protein associated with transcriptional elongation factor ELL [Phytophthora cinnamomi]|uniref:Protein associated with transcriptional elongation factor ELL n=1 Tax=Phytophthora cinnamomi TaxID=4785 RepID=UPI003559FC96|nr:Protein associated with transcriptional elongation factor ELL [Phytophthora cinnamomi]
MDEHEPPTAPLDDHEYSVALGASLLDPDADDEQQQQPSDVFASFGYEFQPASVDKSTPGLVSVDSSSGVHVLMGSSTGAPGGVSFKGKMVEHKETDCLLIFDGSGFRLERCPFSCMQLRHVRAPPPRRRVKIPQAEQASGSGAADTSEAGTSTAATAAARSGKKLMGKAKAPTKRPATKPKGPAAVKRPRGKKLWRVDNVSSLTIA